MSRKSKKEEKEMPAVDLDTGQSGPPTVAEAAIAEGAGQAIKFLESLFDGLDTVTRLTKEEANTLNGLEIESEWWDWLDIKGSNGKNINPIRDTDLIRMVERRLISVGGRGRQEAFSAFVGKVLEFKTSRWGRKE